METYETYKQKMIARLDKCSAEIDALDVKAENAVADVKLKYVEELDMLHTKKREAAKKIKELEAASGEAWENAKLTTDEVLEDLGFGLAQANYKFM
jgi:uncharacterized protein YicC (UPF0701 family)